MKDQLVVRLLMGLAGLVIVGRLALIVLPEPSVATVNPTPMPSLVAASPSQPLWSEPVSSSSSPSPGPIPTEAPSDVPSVPTATPRPVVPPTAPVATPAPAIGSLEARIAAATGITRSVSLTLRARAVVRVAEIQVLFEHGSLALGEAEVIGYNRGYPDPLVAIVAGWLDSPEHALILRDPIYTQIGCAWSLGALERYWFACLLATDAALVVAPLPTPCIPPPACGARQAPSVCLPNPMPSCPA